eukprot:gene39966-9155_t
MCQQKWLQQKGCPILVCEEREIQDHNVKARIHSVDY